MTRVVLVACLALVACNAQQAVTSPSAPIVSLDGKPAHAGKKPPNQGGTYAPFAGLVSLVPSNWTTTPSSCRPTLTNVGGLLIAPIPSSSACTLNYLHLTLVRWALTTAQRLEVDFAVVTTSGSPTFHYNAAEPAYDACAQPVSARLFFWSNNFGGADSDRWWAFGDAVVIAPGQFSLTVPLDPARWVNVNSRNGAMDVPAFTIAISHLNSLGLTLGGFSCNYGHGIYTQSGAAQLRLSRYEVR